MARATYPAFLLYLWDPYHLWVEEDPFPFLVPLVQAQEDPSCQVDRPSHPFLLEAPYDLVCGQVLEAPLPPFDLEVVVPSPWEVVVLGVLEGVPCWGGVSYQAGVA